MAEEWLTPRPNANITPHPEQNQLGLKLAVGQAKALLETSQYTANSFMVLQDERTSESGSDVGASMAPRLTPLMGQWSPHIRQMMSENCTYAHPAPSFCYSWDKLHLELSVPLNTD
ncbi:hypothetical protein NDU88_001660 [Pleurodeles waltl]|uniref:Uncharacterized protein n=1 Tax=Pleurodeles waltl TaxID=8319 RepID=A0AAV7U7H0_PLEWA|nr:hypothetical protein NDU88_001660 [Pleurodeles waltl]